MANPREQKPVIHTKKHMARLERERRQTRYILIGFIGILVLVVGLVIYGYVDINYLQPRRPVATVGDVAISVSDWQARVRMQRNSLIGEAQMYQQYQEYLGVDLSSQIQGILAQLNDAGAVGESVLEAMVDEEVIRQEAASRGITADPQDVERAVQAAFQYYPKGTPTPSLTPSPVAPPTLSRDTLALVTITPTATDVPTVAPTTTPTLDPAVSATATIRPSATATVGPTATLLPTSTPITQEGFEERYQDTIGQFSEIGLSEAAWRRLFENDILRNDLLEEITADTPRSEERVWARHILVADPTVALVVRGRIVKGEDFAKVAAEVSTDTSNKDRGGDLGWFGKGTMVPTFEEAAFSLKVGEISQPVKSDFGYHIIQVLARGEVPLSADEYQKARQEVFKTWLTEARAKYGVVIYDNWRSMVPTDPAAPAVAQ